MKSWISSRSFSLLGGQRVEQLDHLAWRFGLLEGRDLQEVEGEVGSWLVGRRDEEVNCELDVGLLERDTSHHPFPPLMGLMGECWPPVCGASETMEMQIKILVPVS